MRIFEVKINGVLVCNAGIDGPNVMTAILTSHIPNEDSLTKKNYLECEEKPLDLNIAGTLLDSGKIQQWPKINLKIGDEISILIKEVC